jgi:hypothetical protein
MEVDLCLGRRQEWQDVGCESASNIMANCSTQDNDNTGHTTTLAHTPGWSTDVRTLSSSFRCLLACCSDANLLTVVPSRRIRQCLGDDFREGNRSIIHCRRCCLRLKYMRTLTTSIYIHNCAVSVPQSSFRV